LFTIPREFNRSQMTDYTLLQTGTLTLSL
jgi:hypothetical protein